MAQSTVDRIWEGSVPGKLVRWYGNVLWENSLLGRGLSAAGRFVARVFHGSWIGRAVASNWPSGQALAVSRVGRGVQALGRWADWATGRAAPFLNAAWDSSLTGRLWRWLSGWVAPLLETSFFFQTFAGYPSDVALAPTETDVGKPSPLLYVLGFVLGWLALIPSVGRSGLLSPTVLMMAGIWGTAGLWFLQKLFAADFRWRFSSAFLPLVAMLVIFAGAVVNSVPSQVHGLKVWLVAMMPSAMNYVIWFTAIMLFVLMVNLVRTSRDAAAVLGPIFTATILMAVWALYQYRYPPAVSEAWTDPAAGELVRVFAGFDNPNYMAEFMELFLPLGMALWLQQPRRRLILLVPLGSMALALLLTQSRGGWGAAIIGLAVFALLRFGRYNLLLVVAAIAALPLIPQSLVNRFMTSFNPENTSNKYRVSIALGVRNMLKQVWLTGTGLGTEAFVRVYEQFMLPGARAAHAHKTYLQIFAETGILGLGATVWAVFAVLRRTFTVGANSRNAALIAAVPAGLVALVIHSMVDHIWYNPKLLFAFWAMAGLGMGLALGNREDASA